MKFKSLGKRIATVGLAGAMALSMALPAFAADTTDVVTKSDDKYVISKTLKTPANGVTKPTENYTFSIAAGTANITDGSKAGVLPSSATDGKYTVTVNATDLTGSSGTYTGATSADIFSGITYTEEGIYNYTITETAGSTTSMTYSTDSYAVKVKVVKDSSGNFNISGVTASLSGTKKNSIAFTNTYTPWGNSENDTDPDADNSTTKQGLTISKTTFGTEASDDDEFEFSITFTADTNTNSDGSIATTMTSSDDSSNTTTAVTYGTAYTFKLHNNQKINFKVPAGTKYVVTETNTKGYTSTSVKVNNSDVSTASADNSYSTGDQYVSTSTNTVAYTNSHNVGVLTGVVNQYGGLLMIVAIAAAGIVVLSIRRRREA